MSEKERSKLIVETNNDLYTIWDVTEDRYCVNERRKNLYGIYEHVRDALQKDYPDLWEQSDYFSYDYDNPQGLMDRKHEALCPKFAWIAVFYVTGGSEGYYVHVEARDNGKATILFLGKTLREGEAGRAWGEKMVAAISRIMNV